MKHILSLSFALFFIGASAQVSIGNRAGWSISHQVSDESTTQEFLEKNKTTLLGVSAALVLEVKVKDYLAVQTELGLTQKGHQIREEKQDGYYRSRLAYGEGQLFLKGLIGKGSAKLTLLAGGSFGRGLVGITRTAVADSTGFLTQNSDLVDFGPEAGKELNRVEWSLVGGIGGSFDVGRACLFIEGRYVKGLTSINNDPAAGAPELPGIFNRNILVQVGYLVRLNDKAKAVTPPPAGPQY